MNNTYNCEILNILLEWSKSLPRGVVKYIPEELENNNCRGRIRIKPTNKDSLGFVIEFHDPVEPKFNIYFLDRRFEDELDYNRNDFIEMLRCFEKGKIIYYRWHIKSWVIADYLKVGPIEEDCRGLCLKLAKRMNFKELRKKTFRFEPYVVSSKSGSVT